MNRGLEGRAVPMTKLLMISGDRTLAAGKTGAFSSMMEEFHTHFDRIDIICPRVSAERIVRTVYGNVFIHPSPYGLLLQPWFIRRKGRQLFRAHHHDVMTIHEYPPFYNGNGARMLRKKTGIPAVEEIHHIVGSPRAANFSEYVGRLLSRWKLPCSVRTFDATRVVNEGVKNVLASWGAPSNKIHVISSVYLDHAVIDAAKNQPKKFDTVFCSRLVDNKGLDEVIVALNNVPNATLLIVGDGPLRASMEEKVKFLGMEGRVTFTGWLKTSEEVARAVASGKIFLMNSKSEGNPRVAVEAMALGLPVIATKVGIMPDLIGEGVNGIFTDGSTGDVARKLQSLLVDSAKIAAMGREAMTVRERFEKKAAIKAYADFLKSFASRS